MTDFRHITIEEIIAWCKENNQVEWLKATAAKQVETKIYPRVKVAKTDGEGNPILNKKGKVAYTYRTDKTAEPKVELRPITFIQIKQAFCEKFMPELLPNGGKKKQTMFDLINSL